MSKLKRIVFVVVVLLVSFFNQKIFAAPDIMPLKNIQQGMTGRLYTVTNPSGQLESFSVKIIGVMQNGRATQPFIIARSEGSFAETDGGLLQGMSGSPVYVDGKLIGAASATINKMDPHTFLITPIEDMLAIWNLPDEQELRHQKNLQKRLQEKKIKSEKKSKSAKKNLAEEPEKMPTLSKTMKEKLQKEKSQEESQKEKIQQKFSLYANGFDQKNIQFLQEKFSPFGLNLEPSLQFNSTSLPDVALDYHKELKAGDPVGVALAYGDFSLMATGTVTATDGKKILAFGHPFMHRGNVNFFMTDAKILGMVNGISDGLKFANVEHIIGRVNQDRRAGISGILGEFPHVVPIRVNVNDFNNQKISSFYSMMVYEENLLPALSQAISSSSLNRVLDTSAQSSVKVQFKIRTDAKKKGFVERTNFFYSDADTSQQAFGELTQALSLICGDRLKENSLTDIQIDLNVSHERRTASIMSVKPNLPEAKPGDTIQFLVKLKPYRSETVSLSIPFTIPKNQREGTLILDVHGGGFIAIDQLLKNLLGTQPETQILPTEELLDKLEKSTANHEIIIEPASLSMPEIKMPSEQDLKQFLQNQTSLPNPQENKLPDLYAKYATDYFIDNITQTTVKISKKAKSPKPVENAKDEAKKDEAKTKTTEKTKTESKKETTPKNEKETNQKKSDKKN